jgi:type IV pilus assembly protein PilY1
MNSLPKNIAKSHYFNLLSKRAINNGVKLAVLLLCAGAAVLPAQSQTSLADRPIFSNVNVPGNLALLLSVEFPTAVSVAHTDRNYSPTFVREYLGHFDPKKCYAYKYTDGVSENNYFYPVGLATNRTCSSNWSGDFLNWATMQTIDPFRWALTGGYRVVDTVDTTVIEKAWASGQGKERNFPNSTLTAAYVTGATPFPAGTSSVDMRIQGLGNKMRFAAPTAGIGANFTAKYYNNITMSGSPVLTRNESIIDYEKNNKWIPGVNKDIMSATWVGKVTALTAGKYTFRVRADDGVRLKVNGVPLPVVPFDRNWQDQGPTDYDSQEITVAAGSSIDIAIEFYQRYGGAEISLQWKQPGAAGFTLVSGSAAAPAPSLDGAAQHYQGGALTGGVVYEVFARTKVCDSSAAAGGLESNCVAYGANYKPEGLIQKYSNKIRYSAFGYLNDSNVLRDGGVLRAQQKFVGPKKPVSGALDITNTESEWDATTGIFSLNPNKTDADNTAAIMGVPSVVNSGVINYLNKFGEITRGDYKSYDNVGELYYAAIRYFKNLPNVPEWTAVPAGTSAANRVQWTDGFPVIKNPADPIIYACQKNFALGIGDVNTHADKNVPGSTMNQSEPPMPAQVSADTSVNVATATNLVGVMEGLGTSLGETNSFGGNNNSALMAGLAYHSHVNDIRSDLVGSQTIDTYWVDVQEYQVYKTTNQFYLAAKYGGFSVPDKYDYTRATALDTAWWTTSGETKGGQSLPDNYFLGGRPDLMVSGLDKAFTKISEAIGAFTTSFSLPLPQLTQTGNASYSSQYDPNNWTGEVTASSLSFDPKKEKPPTLKKEWSFSEVLGNQIKDSGWDTNRRVVTWNGTQGVEFRGAKLEATDLATLNTSYVTGDDSVDYINYLRGDITNHVNSTKTGSTKAYRSRAKLIGDIVGSKAKAVGAPNFPYADATNPGYSEFKNTWKNRPTVIYVGANDGMMHAINGTLDATKTTSGQEMFAYIPRSLFQGPSGTPNVDGLASLGRPDFEHHYMVNATPNVYDIDFARTPNAAKLPQTGTPDWRSVLIGGLGKGGRSYYAIDVTNPQGMVSGGETAIAGKVLWEFSKSNELGFTFGDPVVTKTKKYGWVVIIPSGYNNATGKGYFFILNPRTGALLETRTTTEGSITQTAGLAHAEGFVNDVSDGTSDAVYAGDLLGNVWRLDLTAKTGDYPEPLKFATLTTATSPATAQPVTTRPSIEIHPKTKKRYVLVGTGRLLDTVDIASTQRQTYYSIIDGSNAKFNTTLPASLAFPITRAMLVNNSAPLVGITTSATAPMGWYEELGVDVDAPATSTVPARTGTGIAWRVTLDSTTLLGSTAFAATLPNGDACAPSGNSRIYGRDFSTGETTLGTYELDSNGKSKFIGVSYVFQKGTATDIQYVSQAGVAGLLSGFDTGAIIDPPLKRSDNFELRRLNWRELQVE